MASTVNYQSNSNKSKTPDEPPREKTEKVVTGKVIERKKPLGKRLADTFTGDDMKSVGGYVLLDVIVPSLKDMVFDAFKEGLQRALYGDAVVRPRGGTSYTGNARPTPYNRMARPATPINAPRTLSSRARQSHEFREIVLDDRGQAETVLDTLSEILERYDWVSVADFYDAVGVSSDFTDSKYGWRSLQGASAVRVREGYLIDLPKTEPID